MNDNPYETPAAPGVAIKTRSTRWLIWSGIVSLLMAVGCLVCTVVLMVLAFQNVAAGGASTPKPSQLAQGISNALYPAYFMMPLVLVGIVLLVLGFVVRQPVHE